MSGANRLGKIKDEDLAARAIDGAGDAFEELVIRYQDRIFTMLVQLCGSHSEAEDLTQETFLKAYRSLSTFKQESKFYTWLFRIAVNAGISRGRMLTRRRVREGVSLDAPVKGSHSMEDGTTTLAHDLASARDNQNPGQEMELRELRTRVQAGIEELPAEYKTVVLLRDMEGMDYDAIAEALSITRAAVKSRLHRARIQLAGILRDLNPQEDPRQV